MKIFIIISTLIVLANVISKENINNETYIKSLKKEFSFRYVWYFCFFTFFTMLSYVTGVIYFFFLSSNYDAYSTIYGGIIAYLTGLFILNDWLKLILLKEGTTWYSD